MTAFLSLGERGPMRQGLAGLHPSPNPLPRGEGFLVGVAAR